MSQSEPIEEATRDISSLLAHSIWLMRPQWHDPWTLPGRVSKRAARSRSILRISNASMAPAQCCWRVCWTGWTPAGAGRTLTATLRVPGPQLEAAMAELKKLGRVEDELQGGEEVTQQYVDLQARLANGKHTEQRLTEILRTRTGKLQDVLKVELEIDRVRGEIEQMQAEQKELTKRVAFATLNTTIQEEYFARLQSTPPSTGSRFRNAAVDGYNTVIEGLIEVALFLLSAGPSLLLWAAILFFPARWVWKKLRRKFAEPDLPSAS